HRGADCKRGADDRGRRSGALAYARKGHRLRARSGRNGEPAEGSQMNGKAARRRAREFALQGIYQWLLSGNSLPLIEAHIEQESDFDKADREFFVALLRGTLNNVATLESAFSP